MHTASTASDMQAAFRGWIVAHLSGDCFFICYRHHYFANHFESATMADFMVKKLS